MRINKLASWIKNNPVETWLVIGLFVLFSGVAIMATLSYEGVLPNGTSPAPVVLVHATPGLGK